MWNAFTLFCLTLYPRTENRKCILLPLNIIWWGNYTLQGFPPPFLEVAMPKCLQRQCDIFWPKKKVKKLEGPCCFLQRLGFFNRHWVLKELCSFFFLKSLVEILEGSLKNVSNKICDDFLTPQWDSLGKWLLVSLLFLKSPFYVHVQNNFTVQVSFR